MTETRYHAPGWFTRNIFNRAVRRLTRLGISVWGSRELRVRGRKSGQLRTTPVNVVTVDDVRYLVAPRGITEWVRNIRVASVAELRVGRRVEGIRVVELDDAAKEPVLRAYLKRWKFEVGMFFEGIDADSLAADPGGRFDLVLTNPPFGKKSSVTFVTDEGETKRESQTIFRDDFWTSTSNKQLNFVQHVKTILKMNGRAAIVVPDNVLFEGGAGETIRRKLLHEADVHTLLRLPTGVFYAQGVKANILFFDRKPASERAWTETLWIYDLRTNMDFSLKQKPLSRGDLDEFVECFNSENRHDRNPTWSEGNPQGRWRSYGYDELLARDKVSLDIFWLRDESFEDSANLPEPDVLAAEIVQDLQAALEQFAAIAEDLEAPGIA